MIDWFMVARIIHFASVAMLAGLMSFLLFVAEPVFRGRAARSPQELGRLGQVRRHLIRLGWAMLGLSVVSGAAWLVLLAVRWSGQSFAAGTSRYAVWTVLTETRFGEDWLVRLVLAALLAVWLTRIDAAAGWRRRWDGPTAVLLSACFIGSLAWAGHGGANPGTSGIIQAAGDALHLVAAGAWIGGLVPFALLMAAARRAGDAEWNAIAARITARFSTFGVVIVATLLLTGILNSWFLAGSVPALVGTPYGRLLLLKIGLFAAMVALAAVNRLRLMPRLRDPEPAPGMVLSRLLRNALIETALGLAILAIVGALGTISPAAHTQPVWPFPVRISLDALSDPARRLDILMALVASLAGITAIFAGMFMKRLRWPLLTLGALIVIGSAPRLDPLAVEANPTTFYASPSGFSAHSIATGRELFSRNCVSCHGPEGRGDGPAAADLRKPPADLTEQHIYAHSDGDLFWWITRGIGDYMPPFGAALDDTARWNLIDFIHANADATRLREAGNHLAGAYRTPALSLECPDESTPPIDALRGRIVHIVVARKGSAARPNRLAHAVMPDVATIVIRLAGADADGPFCSTDDPDVIDAFALYRGAPVDDLDGTEFLLDAAGSLRAMWHPGLAPDWSEPQALAAAIAGVRQAKAPGPTARPPHVHQ